MTDIERHWAARRVDALADGTLPAAEAARMRAALAKDAALRAEVERAAALRAELRRLGRAPVPHGLVARLWAIPRGGAATPIRRPRFALAAGFATAVVAVAAVALGVLHAERERERREAEAAVREVEIALAYLERSSKIAADRVQRALQASMLAAAETGRKAVRDDDREQEGG